MASSLNNFLFISSLLLFCISLSSAKTVPFRPKGLVLPVYKDKCTNQYVTELKQRTPLVPVKLLLDLGARFMWVDCDQGYVSSTYKPVSCDSKLCALANSMACATECNSAPKPGCHNNTCAHSPENPVLRLSTGGQIGQDVVSLQSFNGKKPDRSVSVPDFPFVCGSTFLLENLADGVTGLAGLGNSNISLPAQFSGDFALPKKFSVCLSNSTKPDGAVFFGNGPSIPKNALTYTPLLKNPVSTAGSSFLGEASVEYFIGVQSIKIAGKEVKFNKTLLSIDSEGKGGTKISTVNPYTVLQSSIYKAVVKAFVKEMDKKFIPHVEPPPVGPFEACFQSIVIDNNGFGPDVPVIDLVLGNVNWRIWGGNSMVKMSSLVMCLGVLDGGENPTTSVVIGGHQIEDNFLQFDLASSRLGFSSSLLGKNTTCSKINT
ncbi:probable aspartic proteinase GIP2 [Mercurialis annua]|uniref:probable aspartic proteinase GIP2 n=1 Tax=Mercurialis annua TaxID=3986 RepID=UPI002160B0D2|nr:probable aspartic proteinase GIP2 [Mercurialis annua]